MVLEVLDRYLIEMSRIIVAHDGMVDKFMGDSIMALFGVERTGRDDAGQAVACAVAMQVAMAALNERHKLAALPPIYMGIGVNTGIVSAGHFGSELYSVFTVIGNEVNLASRIEAVSLRGQVLISEQTFAECRDSVAAGEPMTLYVKGKAQPIAFREVTGIPGLGLNVPRMELRRSPRVEAKLPFSFRTIEDEVLGQECHGTALDIGYHGLLVHVHSPIAAHSELRIDLPLPLIDYVASGIYAKVVKAMTRGSEHLAAVEFTSISEANADAVRHFVQLLV